MGSYIQRLLRAATALQNTQSPRSIRPYALTFGCIATGGMIIFYKFQDKKPVRGGAGVSMNQELESKVQCVLPDMFRKGHSVVIAGFISPENRDDWTASQFCFSATEVLTKPEQVTAAIERNNIFIAEKLEVDWYTTRSKAISKAAADPSKAISNSNGKVTQVRALLPELEVTVADSLDFILVGLQGLPLMLREGHSVVVKGFVEPITGGTKDDKLDEIMVEKPAKSVTVKTRSRDYHFSAEVLANHDEKYFTTDAAIEWNITESRENPWKSLAKSC